MSVGRMGAMHGVLSMANKFWDHYRVLLLSSWLSSSVCLDGVGKVTRTLLGCHTIFFCKDIET